MQASRFRNEMLELDGIIRKDIARFLYESYPLTEALFQGFTHELSDSVKDAKKRIFDGSLRCHDMDSRREYIIFHQQKLVELAGRLADHAGYNGVPEGNKHAESKVLLHALYEALDELLGFISTFFASALPTSHLLSVDYYSLVVQEVGNGLEKLEGNFRSLRLSSELVDVTMAPLTKFVNTPSDNDLTYSRQTFIKKLKYELSRLYELRGKMITDEDLHQLLFTLNFNSLAYLRYVGRSTRHRIDLLLTAAQKIDALRQIQRDVSQIIQFPDVAFDAQNPQLKLHVMDWLQQEIHFWEVVHELPVATVQPVEFATPQNPHLVYKGIPKKKPNRLKTRLSLSVKQIAFMLRIFHETEVIEEADMKELLRDLSAIFRSKQKEFISANSLYKKMSEVDSSTAMSIKNLFLKLAKHIENTY